MCQILGIDMSINSYTLTFYLFSVITEMFLLISTICCVTQQVYGIKGMIIYNTENKIFDHVKIVDDMIDRLYYYTLYTIPSNRKWP